VGSGPHELLDLFEGRGVQEGAMCYLVITKRAERTPAGKHTLTHNVSHKGAVNAAGLSDAVAELEVAALADVTGAAGASDLAQALVHNFTPFELHAVIRPDGGALDMAFQEWTDELGHTHHDAHIMRLGRILFTPKRFRRMPALAAPTDAGFAPLRNGLTLMVRERIEAVLFDPCKDGAFGML